VVITGNGFLNAADQRVVFPVAGGFVRVVPSTTSGTAALTNLTVPVPADALSGPIHIVRVDAPVGGESFPFLVAGTPTPLMLTGIAPFFGVAPGTVVTLTGSGFSSAPANNTVLFTAGSPLRTGHRDDRDNSQQSATDFDERDDLPAHGVRDSRKCSAG
jgi:hypothetical protein